MGATKKETIIVSAALIFKSDKVLICKRPEGKRQPGYWEFPGGKVESGEDPRAALEREIREELGVSVTVNRPVEVLSHSYDFGNVLLIFFESIINDGGEPVALHHEEIQWERPENLEKFEFLPADEAFIKKLARGNR